MSCRCKAVARVLGLLRVGWLRPLQWGDFFVLSLFRSLPLRELFPIEIKFRPKMQQFLFAVAPEEELFWSNEQVMCNVKPFLSLSAVQPVCLYMLNPCARALRLCLRLGFRV